jgi:hypothetical protein
MWAPAEMSALVKKILRSTGSFSDSVKRDRKILVSWQISS